MIMNAKNVGRKGLRPQIVVEAPTGAVVECETPAGAVMTAVEESGVWKFEKIAALGTYTVRVSIGGQATTYAVVVNKIGRFFVDAG